MESNEVTSSDGFLPVYKEISEIIGPEYTYEIFKNMRGQQVTFPKRLYSTDFVIDKINSSDGINIRKIALEYDYTEKYIRQKLKERGTTEKL